MIWKHREQKKKKKLHFCCWSFRRACYCCWKLDVLVRRFVFIFRRISGWSRETEYVCNVNRIGGSFPIHLFSSNRAVHFLFFLPIHGCATSINQRERTNASIAILFLFISFGVSAFRTETVIYEHILIKIFILKLNCLSNERRRPQ